MFFRQILFHEPLVCHHISIGNYIHKDLQLFMQELEVGDSAPSMILPYGLRMEHEKCFQSSLPYGIKLKKSKYPKFKLSEGII